MVNAQDWLEQNYPDKETRSIYLNQQLEGVLDCQEYERLEHIFISTSVDSSKLEIKGGSYEDNYDDEEIKTEIISCLPVQTYLDQAYPTQQARAEVKELNISEKGLEGNLDLSDFSNLEGLWCYDNYLTQIVYPTNPEKITDLRISNNNLNSSDLTIFSQLRNLKRLDIDNTDKSKISQGIYNRIEGSCEPLKDLNNLLELNISNTDINSGWEYLPNSLGEISYESWLRPNCQLAPAQAELEKELWKDIHQDFVPPYNNKLLRKDWLEAGFSKEQTKEIFQKGSQIGVRPQDGAFLNWFLNFKKLDLNWAKENEEEFKNWRDEYSSFGTCEECQQPNTSYKWCHSCNAQHFQDEFKSWTSGNPRIDNFIQKCQLEATSDWNVLEWISYEKFENIEHIADGGFGQVYKAEWEEGYIEIWDKKEWKRRGDDNGYGGYKNYKTAALKTLSNSQNLNQDFLSELTLYKMFRSSVSNMVPCYGISRDKEGNYILVMGYMEAGNLREYLRKNYQGLDLKRRLNFLQQISQGLKDIHRKKLVHRDFHSGNIIVNDKYSNGNVIECHITDLGLSKPVNEVATENKIYGIMPYVAPEVLKNQPYTPASDIYSFGIVMYEILTGCPPFVNQVHDVNLSLKICRGIRPQFPEQVKYSQILVDLIAECWDKEPNNRPTTREISSIVGEWFDEHDDLKLGGTELYHQCEEAEEFNKTLPEEIKYPNYQSQEVWHSKPINTKQITSLLSTNLTTDLDFENLTTHTTQLNLEDYETEQQSQIEIPPKK